LTQGNYATRTNAADLQDFKTGDNVEASAIAVHGILLKCIPSVKGRDHTCTFAPCGAPVVYST